MDISAKENDPKTPLIKAVEEGDANCVTALIAAGADVNAKDADGKTALIRAIETDNADGVKILIAAGADVNTNDNDGETALGLALRRNTRKWSSYLFYQLVGVGQADLGDEVVVVKQQQPALVPRVEPRSQGMLASHKPLGANGDPATDLLKKIEKDNKVTLDLIRRRRHLK